MADSDPPAEVRTFDRPPQLDERSLMYDVVFVLNTNSRGWILEKICTVIAGGLKLHTKLIFTERNDVVTGWLPSARNYFFSHFKLYMSAVVKEPLVAAARNFIWFTHPSFDGSYSVESFLAAMRKATMIFTANRYHQRSLEFLGIAPERISTILGGADPLQFAFKLRSGNTVGVVGAYYERKNPSLLLQVVRALPQVNFILLAPRPEEVENASLLWENWTGFEQLVSCPNLDYVQAYYGEYGSHYARMDAYLSLSNLEGGPIPLIEAMFANCLPVVTRTGFAEDVVEHGRNGYLLPTNPALDEVVQTLKQALDDRTTDVRATVSNLSWEGFAARFRDIMDPALHNGGCLSFSDETTRDVYLREGWVASGEAGCALKLRAGRIRVRLGEGVRFVTVRFLVSPGIGRRTFSLTIAVNGSLAEAGGFGPGLHTRTYGLPPQALKDGVLELMFSSGEGELDESGLLRVDWVGAHGPAENLLADVDGVIVATAHETPNESSGFANVCHPVVVVLDPGGQSRSAALLRYVAKDSGISFESVGSLASSGADEGLEGSPAVVLDLGRGPSDEELLGADAVICRTKDERVGLAKRFRKTPVVTVGDPIILPHVDVNRSANGPLSRVIWFGDIANDDFASVRWALAAAEARGLEVLLVPLGGDLAAMGEWRRRVVGRDSVALSAALRTADLAIVSQSPHTLLRVATALAAGLPVAVDRSADAEAILRAANLRFGYVTEGGRFDKALELFNDPERRRLFVRRLREFLRREFGFEASANRYHRVLENAAARRFLSISRPNIAFVSHNMSVGEGAPRSLLEIMAGVSRGGAGLDCHLYSVGGGGLMTSYEQLGIATTIFDVSVTNSVKEMNVDTAAIREHFVAFLRREGIGLVVCNTVNSAPFVVYARSVEVPSILIIRESFGSSQRYAKFDSRLAISAEQGVKGADRVIFVSDETRGLWSRDTPFEQVTTIRTGADPDRFREELEISKDEARRRLGVAPGEVIALSVGSVNERKGQADLVAAFGGLSPDVRANVRLIIVGLVNNRFKSEFLTYLSRLPEDVRAGITVVEEVDNPGVYYRAADVFLLNSDSESYPRSVLEALLFGLPVLSTDIFGVKEQVVNGINGLTYSVGDMNTWKEHFTKLVGDRPYRVSMSNRARESFWALPTYPEMIADYMREFAEAYRDWDETSR